MKKQNSVEGASFGSEFCAAKAGVKLIQGLQYKLIMMGVPLEGPAHVQLDNMLVVHNMTNPDLMLKKKLNAIVYHFVRENVAMGTI
jgi:hypothetical protein